LLSSCHSRDDDDEGHTPQVASICQVEEQELHCELPGLENVEIVQGVQALALAAEYVPLGHIEQTSRAENVPAPHRVHCEEPESETLPVLHRLQSVDPDDEKRPGKHKRHSVEPSLKLNEPAVHGTASAEPEKRTYLPAGADRQSL
jgi:hypothetical protein